MMNTTITYKMRNGVTVLGKFELGRTWPKTFANRTQAIKAAEKAGLTADALRQWGRPWFVAVPEDFGTTEGVK